MKFENHREDVRKLVEMMQKEKEDQEGQRGRVAPNMGAGGSHPQAISVPERKETQGMRWANYEDDEGKDEEEHEIEKRKAGRGGRKERARRRRRRRDRGRRREREQEEEKETRQETGQEGLTSEKPGGENRERLRRSKKRKQKLRKSERME